MSNVVRTLDYAVQAQIQSLTTSASGSPFVLFTDMNCTVLDIANFTGVTIEYQRRASGTAFQIANGATRRVVGITNANQIGVRRTDQSVTPVTLQAEALLAG